LKNKKLAIPKGWEIPQKKINKKREGLGSVYVLFCGKYFFKTFAKKQSRFAGNSLQNSCHEILCGYN